MVVSPIAGRSVLDIKTTTQHKSGNSEQLLAVHAVTGCDTISYMWGIGKTTAPKQMWACHLLQNFGQKKAGIINVISEATNCIGTCYRSKKKTDMSAIQYDVWSFKMSNNKYTIVPKLKQIPPMTESFVEHVC